VSSTSAQSPSTRETSIRAVCARRFADLFKGHARPAYWPVGSPLPFNPCSLVRTTTRLGSPHRETTLLAEMHAGDKAFSNFPAAIRVGGNEERGAIRSGFNAWFFVAGRPSNDDRPVHPVKSWNNAVARLVAARSSASTSCSSSALSCGANRGREGHALRAQSAWPT
jgi:hypothetical protein